MKVDGKLHRKLIADGSMRSPENESQVDVVQSKYTRASLETEMMTRLRTIYKEVTVGSLVKGLKPRTKKLLVEAILQLQNADEQKVEKPSPRKGWMVHVQDEGGEPTIQFYLDFSNAVSGAAHLVADVFEEEERQHIYDDFYSMYRHPISANMVVAYMHYQEVSVFVQLIIYEDQ